MGLNGHSRLFNRVSFVLRDKNVGLVPFVDMFNHNNVNVMFGRDQDNFVFNTLNETVAKNAQVYNNYGNKANLYLLCFYGFVLQDNIHDSMDINFNLFDEVNSQDDVFY